MTKPISAGDDKGSPEQKVVAAFHKKDDVSSSREAHHHRIGSGIYDAASGKHNHIDDGQAIFDSTVDIVSGSRNLATGDLPGIVNQLLNILAKIGIQNSTSP